MSKARLPRDAISMIDAAGWRQRIKQLSIAGAHFWPQEFQESTEHNADSLADELLDRPSNYGLGSIKRTRAGCSMTAKDFGEVVLIAFRAGFIEAVRNHQNELMVVGDAASIVKDRQRGNRDGHASQSREKDKRYEMIRAKHDAMEAAGENCTYAAVAAALNAEGVKCSSSTVERAINNRPAKRKKR
jgi:hypothetical protein